MSFKLNLLKLAGAATLAGLAAASQSSGPRGPRKKGGCTPCEAQAKMDAARKRVQNGHL